MTRPDSDEVGPGRGWPGVPSGLAYFEDVQVGQTLRYGRYEVTREEIVAFARQFDPQPFHLDDAAGRQSMFGGLIASGWHTAAMFMRMVADHMSPLGAIQGALGFDDLKWLTPVRPGDVLTGESTVTQAVPSRSRPDRGTVSIASRVLNQRGEAVMSLTSLVIFLRRPQPTAADAELAAGA
jgi:acyl dehydratase